MRRPAGKQRARNPRFPYKLRTVLSARLVVFAHAQRQPPSRLKESRRCLPSSARTPRLAPGRRSCGVLRIPSARNEQIRLSGSTGSAIVRGNQPACHSKASAGASSLPLQARPSRGFFPPQASCSRQAGRQRFSLEAHPRQRNREGPEGKKSKRTPRERPSFSIG